MLRLGLEIRDFDLNRMGFSVSVRDDAGSPESEGYFRMTLPQLHTFIGALKVADDIELSAVVEGPSLTAPDGHEGGPTSGDHASPCLG